MRPFLAVVPDPIIEVGLQAVDRRAELLAEGDAIELVKHCFVETLDDAVIRYEIRGTLLSGCSREGTAIW